MRLEDIYNSQIDNLVLNQDKVEVWADFCRSLEGYSVSFCIQEDGKEDVEVDSAEMEENAIILGTEEGTIKTTDDIADALDLEGEDILIDTVLKETEENGSDSSFGQSWLNTVRVDCETRTLVFVIAYEVME